jgi:hypothetical protein
MFSGCSGDDNKVFNTNLNENVLFSADNFDDTGFNVSVSQTPLTRSLGGENYLISVQEPKTADVSSLVLSLEYHESGNVTAMHYTPDLELIGVVEYDDMYNVISVTTSEGAGDYSRQDGESYGGCVKRLYHQFKDIAKNTTLLNEILYDLYPAVHSTIFLAVSAGCCYYGCP